MSDSNKHWTERTPRDYRFRIASDFVAQLESRLEEMGWSQAKLARSLDVTEGRVSQLLNNPGNLGLDLMVKCARALGMKLAIVAYDDEDKDNSRGPINSEIFRLCWEGAGKPSDFWATNEAATGALVISGDIQVIFSGEPAVQTYSNSGVTSSGVLGAPLYGNAIYVGDSLGANLPTERAAA